MSTTASTTASLPPLQVLREESGPFAGIVTLRLEQPGSPVVVLDEILIRRIEAALRDLPRGIMLLDTLLLPPPEFLQALESVPAALRSPDAPAVIEQLAGTLFLSTDDPGRRTRLIAEMLSTPTEVAYSAFMAHTIGYDPRPAIGSVRVPAAYVRSMPFTSDLNRLQDAWPVLMIAQTLGSGHFAMLEVPEQINAMIDRFASLLP